MTRRWLQAAPLAVVGLSLVWLAIDAGTWWPWTTVVHEDGRRTLLDTIFYPRHFLRELPVLIAYVAALAWVAPPVTRGLRTAASGALALACAGVLVVAALGVVAASEGWAFAGRDVGQYYLRDAEGWPGAHWGGHVLGIAAFAWTAWLVRPGPGPASWRVVITVALMAGLTVPFVSDPRASVLSPRAAGHQVREWMTQVAVTLPLALSAMGVVPAPPWRRRDARSAWPVAVALLVVLAALSGLAIGGSALAARPAPWSARLGAHVLEHTMDYAFVALVCWALRRQA